MLTFLKNEIGQISLVAAETFKSGQVVFDLDMGEFHEHPSLRTIELAPFIHVIHPWGSYTDHSCDPSCYVDKLDRTMRAMRNINIGEKITFNYQVNETNISTGFQCKCGSSKCIGKVGDLNSKPTYLE